MPHVTGHSPGFISKKTSKKGKGPSRDRQRLRRGGGLMKSKTKSVSTDDRETGKFTGGAQKFKKGKGPSRDRQRLKLKGSGSSTGLGSSSGSGSTKISSSGQQSSTGLGSSKSNKEKKVLDQMESDKLILTPAAFNEKYAWYFDRPTSTGNVDNTDNSLDLKYDMSTSGDTSGDTKKGLMKNNYVPISGEEETSIVNNVYDTILNNLVDSGNKDFSSDDIYKAVIEAAKQVGTEKVKQYLPSGDTFLNENPTLDVISKSAAFAAKAIEGDFEFEKQISDNVSVNISTDTNNWKNYMTTVTLQLGGDN